MRIQLPIANRKLFSRTSKFFTEDSGTTGQPSIRKITLFKGAGRFLNPFTFPSGQLRISPKLPQIYVLPWLVGKLSR
jgi:hypothetical protein